MQTSGHVVKCDSCKLIKLKTSTTILIKTYKNRCVGADTYENHPEAVILTQLVTLTNHPMENS